MSLMKYSEKKVIQKVFVGKGIHSTDGPILKEGIKIRYLPKYFLSIRKRDKFI